MRVCMIQCQCDHLRNLAEGSIMTSSMSDWSTWSPTDVGVAGGGVDTVTGAEKQLVSNRASAAKQPFIFILLVLVYVLFVRHFLQHTTATLGTGASLYYSAATHAGIIKIQQWTDLQPDAVV